MKNLLILFVLIFLSACAPERSNEFSLTHDLEKSEILVSGKGVADGQSFFYFDVLLKNSNDKIVPGLIPELEVDGLVVNNATNSSANTSKSIEGWLQCSVSNIKGVSRCAMRSIKAGIYDVEMPNVNKKLIRNDVEFGLPVKTNFATLVQGSQKAEGAGYEARVSLTHKKGPLNPVSSGYTIFRGISSISDSQN